MRVSREEMQENHTRILHNAARLLRERGLESTSVADVMNAAGLTHGGFYRHFKDKDQLLAAAITAAFDQIADRFEKTARQQGPHAAALQYQRQYLSPQHCQNPGLGCPVAALGGEISRAPKVVRDSFSRGAQRLVQLLAQGLGSEAEAHRRIATLVGAILIARASDPATATLFLQSCRQSLSLGDPPSN